MTEHEIVQTLINVGWPGMSDCQVYNELLNAGVQSDQIKKSAAYYIDRAQTVWNLAAVDCEIMNTASIDRMLAA
jgi:hypothetical protein